jgi:hypothetical protein
MINELINAAKRNQFFIIKNEKAPMVATKSNTCSTMRNSKFLNFMAVIPIKGSG